MIGKTTLHQAICIRVHICLQILYAFIKKLPFLKAFVSKSEHFQEPYKTCQIIICLSPFKITKKFTTDTVSFLKIFLRKYQTF